MIKTGIDIIEVSRIKENIEKYGDAFLHRVFTEKEIEYCEARNIQKNQSYAGRFAAKEAVFKAVSWVLESKFDIEWKDIEVLNDEKGRPYVRLSGNIGNALKKFRNGELLESIDISISHINDIAVASVAMATGKIEIGDVSFGNGDGSLFQKM